MKGDGEESRAEEEKKEENLELEFFDERGERMREGIWRKRRFLGQEEEKRAGIMAALRAAAAVRISDFLSSPFL